MKNDRIMKVKVRGFRLIKLVAAMAPTIMLSALVQSQSPQQPPVERRFPIPENAPPPTSPPLGPYAVEIRTDPTLPTHTLFEPESPRGKKSPVVLFGNGGCQNNNSQARAVLSTIASHGFLVIAPGAKDTTERGTTTDVALKAALDWAEAQNRLQGSPLQGKLEPNVATVSGWSCGGLQAIANASDPRIRSVILFNSGTFEQAKVMNSLTVANKASLQKLHSPILYLIGGPEDVAYAQAEDDFKKIERVPVFKANINTGHLGTFAHPNGGWYAEVASAWLMWTLKNDKKASRYFVGSDCTLCTNPIWTIGRKNFPE